MAPQPTPDEECHLHPRPILTSSRSMPPPPTPRQSHPCPTNASAHTRQRISPPPAPGTHLFPRRPHFPCTMIATCSRERYSLTFLPASPVTHLPRQGLLTLTSAGASACHLSRRRLPTLSSPADAFLHSPPPVTHHLPTLTSFTLVIRQVQSMLPPHNRRHSYPPPTSATSA